MLAGELANALIKKFQVRDDNARKIISRAFNDKIVASTKPLSFGKGMYYYYLPGNTPSVDELKAIAREKRPPVYRLLDLLHRSGGIISFYEGLKVTSSPEEGSSTKMSKLTDIVSDLAEQELVIERRDENGTVYILEVADEKEDAEASYEMAIEAHRKRMEMDVLFFPDIVGWLLSLNILNTLGAYRNVATPGFGVIHNRLYWDAFSYSKVSGIHEGIPAQSNTPDKQTLVVMDIVLHRNYSMTDFDGFISRIQINNNSVKKEKRKCIPIIIYHEIEDQALYTARKNGFLIFSMARMYGTHVSKLLTNIQEVYNSPVDEISDKIAKALHRIKVSGLVDQLKMLRGALFEQMMRVVIEHQYPNAQIKARKIIKEPGHQTRKREFDYVINSETPREIVLIELKGYAENAYVDLGEPDEMGTLRYFFRGSVPLAQSYYKGQLEFEHVLVKALFITTGTYARDAKNLIDNLNTPTNKLKPTNFPSCVMDRNELIIFLRNNSFTSEIDMIKKYYIENKEED